jgi:hypothetical protein
MVEPVTLGAVVASALAMAAEAALKGSVGEAAKEAYQALKGKIAEWTGYDVDLLEKDPASKGRQTVVAEKLDRQSEADKAEMRDLALRLIESLKHDSGAALDIGYLEATEVELGNITVGRGAQSAIWLREAKLS